MQDGVATRRSIAPRARRAAGVGLRLPHLTEVATSAPPAAWFEVHPENFLANPHAMELLHAIAGRYAISVHTVGVSIGSAGGIDRVHLARLRQFVLDLDPILVSGHLAWSTHEDAYLNDLLPLPYDDETLRLVATQLHLVQDAIGRPYLVENPSSYVGVGTSTMTEVEFLAELARRTDCLLLCDVSNVFLSGHNMGYDPYRYIDRFPAAAVGELHLGGFVREADEGAPGDEILIDSHSTVIAEPVWQLYAHAVRRFGPAPTLIEWDNDIPPLSTLLAEATRADTVSARALMGQAV
ncbi:MAG TPA: DUF692 domain-containing protein [Vicinamibacterales bacterium]|nr:DUF692 domain-containing protein [Vicinamibacterales bacterium]